MNIGRLSPNTLPAPVARPADAAAVRNAQAAFFAAATGVAAPQVAARPPAEPVQPAAAAAAPRAEAPDRPTRPGALLDIRV